MRHYGKQYRVIAPDQRGHGLSSKPIAKYSSGEMAEDIIDLLFYLKIDSVILVGHSMGGAIVAYLSALYSKYIKGVAILDKSAADYTLDAKSKNVPLDKLRDPLTHDWPLPFSSLNEAMSFMTQKMDSDLSCQYFMNSLVETVDGYKMMFSSQAMAANSANYESWYHLLPSIKCPVLLIRSKSHEAVRDVDFLKMQSLFSNCLAYEMSESDHNVH